MEVDRRGLFGLFAGAAASGKSIVKNVEEAVISSNIHGKIKAASIFPHKESDAACKAGSIKDSPSYWLNYWKKELKKLIGYKQTRQYKDRLLENNLVQREIEIEGMKSLSYSSKLRMISNAKMKTQNMLEESKINNRINNLLAGRDAYDDGD